jgi:asparagine synthase (glutamine-hydrolysing)
MWSLDRRLLVTFNGEIYNFQELRAELERRGHRFRTRTDTEVILAAYDEYGADCLHHFRGMFAFGLWDSARHLLLLARDRLGKKPLFYRLDKDGIEFSSEPKAFLANPDFAPEADPAALLHYLVLQYVPSPHSAFKGVFKLPPAHRLVVKSGHVDVRRYWRLRYEPKLQCGVKEAEERLFQKLDEAVRLRLIADVPLGAFLSGGLDSATIVALMARASSARVKTFSIGFEEEAFNELPAARTVADRFETEHHVFIVRPDAVGIVPRLVWHYGEPYGDSSAIPTFCLAELTRRHVTVALNGDGGDENLAGYDRYLANVLAARADRLILPVMRPLLREAARWVHRGARFNRLWSRAGRLLEGLADEPERRYARWLTHFHPDMHDELLTDEFRGTVAELDPLAPVTATEREAGGTDLVDRTLAIDVENYLADDLLVKVDIATMAYGLEARSPFVDHEVMELCARLPSNLKLHGTTKKYLLRRIASQFLPDEIVGRPKMGFGVPLGRWFRQELREMAYDVLLSPSLRGRGILRPRAVARMLDEHASGRYPWHHQIWNLLMLESWFRTFIDRRPVGPVSRADGLAFCEPST